MTFSKYNSEAMNFPESCHYAMRGKSLKAKATAESPDHWITLKQSEQRAAPNCIP